MPSKSNNIEIMVGNENEVTEELIWSFLHMYFFFHLCFLYKHSQFTGQQEKGERISL